MNHQNRHFRIRSTKSEITGIERASSELPYYTPIFRVARSAYRGMLLDLRSRPGLPRMRRSLLGHRCLRKFNAVSCYKYACWRLCAFREKSNLFFPDFTQQLLPFFVFFLISIDSHPRLGIEPFEFRLVHGAVQAVLTEKLLPFRTD
jgi:hypothetical protein